VGTFLEKELVGKVRQQLITFKELLINCNEHSVSLIKKPVKMMHILKFHEDPINLIGVL
jgi:hypothetical protein